MFLSSACGSGGGSSESRDTTMLNQEISKRTYKLYPENYLNTGYSEEYSLAGTIDDNTTVNAKLKISMVGESNQHEKTSFFTEQTLDLFFSDGSTKNRRIINDSSLSKAIHSRIYPGNNNNINNTIKDTPLPDSAEIGAFGVLFEAINLDGNTETTSWALEYGGNNNVKLIIQTEIKNIEHQIVYFENISFGINQKGERQNVSLYLEYPFEDIILRLKQ
jgi:hypothetical protein